MWISGRSGLTSTPRRLSSKASSFAFFQMTLTLTVPEYSNKRVSRPVQVYFYVSNGRRKRSPTQSFKFLPGVPGTACGGVGGMWGVEAGERDSVPHHEGPRGWRNLGRERWLENVQ